MCTLAMPSSTFLPIQKRTLDLPTQAEAAKHSEPQGDWSASHTSAGSSSTSSRFSRGDEWSPDNWPVRNTFLEMPQLTVMQGFQRNRRAWSCPAGGREAAEREEFAAVSPGPSLEDDSDVGPPAMTKACTESWSEAPRPLALADLVGPQSHSKGSVLHFQGTCKPCAFFWKVVGCKYGSECEFCHLCDADERKRRNKEKRMAMHALQSGGRPHLAAASTRHVRGGRLLA